MRKAFSIQVKAYHEIEVKSLGVGEDDGKGNGVSLVEYKLSVDMKAAGKFNPNHVQVLRWGERQGDAH